MPETSSVYLSPEPTLPFQVSSPPINMSVSLKLWVGWGGVGGGGVVWVGVGWGGWVLMGVG